MAFNLRFEEFYEKLMLRYGMEHFGVFYSTYRAIVTRNDDPERRGRIQLKCPRAGHIKNALPRWVDPSVAFSGADFGAFFPPVVGSTVFVTFENGDPGKPAFYQGGWFAEEALPSEFAPLGDSINRPERRGIVTRAGHSLIFDDEAGSERVRLTWHKPATGDASLTDPTVAADRTQGDFGMLTMEPDGTVVIANKVGARVELNTAQEGAHFVQVLDENGNSVTLDSDGVKVADQDGNYFAIINGKITLSASSEVDIVAPTVNLKAGTVFLGDGATQSVVIGESFLQYFNSHSHATGTGPSGPPTVPMTQALLSKTVKVKT